MDIVDILEEQNYSPRKKSAKEYCSACPYCREGNDRLVIKPSEGKGGSFWCRVCRKSGDAINLLRDLQGLTYPQACAKLKIDPGKRTSTKRDDKPIIAENPPNAWSEKANAFVEWSHSNLLQTETFLSAVTKRGLTLETIKRFKIGYNPKRIYRDRPEWGLPSELKENGKPRRIWLPAGIVIPTFEEGKLVKVKIRNRDYEKELEKYEAEKVAGKNPKFAPSKYVGVAGSKKAPSVYGNTSLDVLLIQESELDAILVVQEVGDLCFCLALGGTSQPLDLHKERIVRGVGKLLFCPDFDIPGKESLDKWMKRFPDTIPIVPEYGKDATESFKLGANLREWIAEVINK